MVGVRSDASPGEAKSHHALVSQNLLRAANDGYDVSPLLECGADPMSSDVDGRLAIHYAAMNGHTMSVLALAAYGADVNSCTKNGRTALHGACWNGHTQAALQLIEMGADTEVRSVDGATPLMDAARNGHQETVTALVTIVGADVSAIDHNGRGCLHFAALNGHDSMVQTLVKLSADVDSKDNDGCRPLHLASWSGHRETVKMLLRLGADPCARDANMSTALHDAALSGRTGPAALLIECKADVDARNKGGLTPLHHAGSSGHVDATLLLLHAKADINAANDDYRSALHFATWNCHPRVVLVLLQHGADMSLSGADGVTAADGLCHPDFDWPPDLLGDVHSLRLPNSPMHTAAKQGHTNRVTSLAGCGVDVNCQNIVGDTPLHWAVRNRRLATSTRLLELGADVMRCNDQGVSVRKDVLVHMDLVQQEMIKRKLVELAQQPARIAGARPTKSGPSTPDFADINSPHSVSSSSSGASGMHQAEGSSEFALTEFSNTAEGSTPRKYRRTPSHATPSSLPTPPNSPRHLLPVSSHAAALTTSCSPPAASTKTVLPFVEPVPPERERSKLNTGKAGTFEIEKSGQNPRDCNPDHVHNLLSPQDQSSTHPIRYACMQVDAWASKIPGVRWWRNKNAAASWQSQSQTAKALRRRPVLFMLDRPTEVSENIQWRVKSTLVECRAAREAAMRRIGKLTKIIAQVATGNFAEVGKELPMKLDPWVQKKVRTVQCGVINCVSRWKWRGQIVKQAFSRTKTAGTALSVVALVFRGKSPTNILKAVQEQTWKLSDAINKGPVLQRVEGFLETPEPVQ